MNQEKILRKFETYLIEKEKSKAARVKYLKNIRHFYADLRDKPMTKQEIISYKQSLLKRYKFPL